MANVSTGDVVNLFKRVYGQMNDLVFKDSIVDDLLPFSASQRVGQDFVEAFTLGMAGGITFAGTAQSAFSLNDAVSMTVKQSRIIPSQSVLTDVIPYSFASRGIDTEMAFGNSTRTIVENHLKSHNQFVSVAKMYGQSAAKLGYVSYAPSGTVYRGATYSGNGNITLTRTDGTTISFTAGVTTTTGITGVTGAILLAPGQYASGFWVGKQDTKVLQLDANNLVVASGTIKGTDASLGILYVSFVPVAASSTTSHKLAYDGWENSLEMVGVQKILSNQGSLFDIDAGRYELWRGSSFDLGNKAFSLRAVQAGIGYATNAGGLDKPLDIVINPNAWAVLTTNEAALRKYDSAGEATNGFETVEFYAANGANRIHASNLVKEGDAFGFLRDTWRCSGSQSPSFKINGLNQEVIFPLNAQAGWAYRSFSDQYVFCRAPAKNLYWANGNFEGVSY